MSDHELDAWSPRGPVVELSEAGCWELLCTHSFGRLGLSAADQPDIFPVDDHADGSVIVFRTASGTKMRELVSNSSVVFEVDERTEQGSWSVVVRGTADVLEHPDDIAAADRLQLPEWIPVATYVYVRITPTTVRGRRFLRRVEVER
jgi:nitroimidazol reductase NimA-like FMN-containing flavoprotein (pyridoxamine 5'-phosphate oxidase superfamily)